ncbi:MAG: hypothetical protein ABEJ72_08085, partial [Candidatus Aenigmatarchaeota archaeon]
DRLRAFESVEDNEKERTKFAVQALDDEASWLVTRYPQFFTGTLLGIGGTGYSILNGDFGIGSAIAVSGGGIMTYTAFNGTATTIDKMLTFKDNIPEQQQVWEAALDEHRMNGFASRDLSPEEVNEKVLHPLGASHNIAYK